MLQKLNSILRLIYDAIQSMNKTKPSKNTKSNCQHHQQGDNCEGCQKQRSQNHMLVDFYERINKMQTKIEKIKGEVISEQTKQIEYRNKIEEMGKIMQHKPEQALKKIKEKDSKEMGYELATALIEREIKIKIENQRLQAMVDQLQKEKKKLQQERRTQNRLENSLIFTSKSIEKHEKETVSTSKAKSIDRYSDAIDEVRNTQVGKTHDSSYFLSNKKEDMSNSYFHDDRNRKYWQQASIGQDQTNFSNFSIAPSKEKSKSQGYSNYAGLNLWLYQFKPEQLQDTNVKSLKKPNLSRLNNKANQKYKSKF